jgi:hypothetical protein
MQGVSPQAEPAEHAPETGGGSRREDGRSGTGQDARQPSDPLLGDLVFLRKETGGTTIPWEGRHYHWPAADPVCEVPPALGHVLLNIRGAGYAEVPAPPKPAPAPKSAAKADDPAPAAR